MKLSRLLPLLALLFCLESLSAQDLHFTLFNMSPLTMNPALTGAFEGTARIGGIYRGQWTNVGSGFVTPSIYADAPVIRGFRERDWVGVGLLFLSDQAGTNNLDLNLGGLSASYHLALDKKGSTMLTIGAQYNQVNRRLNAFRAFSEQNIETGLGGGGLNPGNTEFDAMGGSERNTDYSDINAGLLLRSAIDSESSFEIGFSALHLGTPNAGLRGGGAMGGPTPGGGSTPSDRRLTFISHGKYETMLDEKWSIAPTFFFQTTEGGRSEVSIQAWAGRQINTDLKLNFGLGYRVNDAAKVLIGADYKDLRAALSYDINVSSANPITNYNGGFELAAYYIIKVYKKPELTPKVLCPRF